MGQEQPGNPNHPEKGLEVDPGGLDKEEINLNPSPGPEKEIPQPIEPQPDNSPQPGESGASKMAV